MRPSDRHGPDAALPAPLPSMGRVIRLGYRSEPGLLVASLAMTVLQALPDALVAVWIALITRGVLDGSWTPVWVGAVGLAASAAAMWVLQVTLGRTQRRLGDRLNIMFQTHVAELQASVATVEHHERPEYLDRIAVLRNGIFALDHLFGSMFTMIGWIIRLAFVAIVLATIHPVLALLVVFAAPLLVVATWRPQVERATEERVAAHARLANHLIAVTTSTPPAKEVRITGHRAELAQRRRAEWERWYQPVAAARTATALFTAAAWLVFATAFVAAIVWVAAGLEAGPTKVVLAVVAGGQLARYVSAAVGELGFLRGIWLDSAQRLAWLEAFAARSNDGADLEPPGRLVDGIAFEDVSFAYPGTDRFVLEHVDLRLPAGTVIAVVGENGAGKTTLVKLLARMYAPTSGRITVDGVDLARISADAWRARLSGAFQDFSRFEFAARTTVGVGDLPRHDDAAAVTAAVERAGAGSVVDELRHGLDTQLGPSWDEGVDVSYGQWQKLALARGYMRPEPLLLVLDEPTAALDAETEHALFKHYASTARRAAAHGGITVLVSHRFSTVRMADLIVVLDGSRVAEFGTHDELMAASGVYADLYTIQAASYS